MDDARADRLESKIDKITEQLSEMNVTMAKQEVNLQLHMKRSDLLEKQMIPVRKHVAMVHGVVKFIGVLSILSGIALSLVEIIKALK